MSITCISLYNDTKGHFIISLLAQIIQVVMLHVSYLVPATSLAILTDFLVIVLFTLGMLCGTLSVLYIMDLHAVLEDSNSQNAKLLDGMHESLCILKKETNFADEEVRQVLFCNKPAIKLLFDEKTCSNAKEENSTFTTKQFESVK